MGSTCLSALTFRLHAGSIDESDYARARDEWTKRVRDGWKAAGRIMTGELDWLLWARGYGNVSGGEQMATAALAAMPKQLTDAMKSGAYPTLDLRIGQTLVLAGKPSEAVAPLRRATRVCSVITHPMTTVHAQYYLGLALERTGDPQAARKAYGVVLRHWTKARPPSVTAEKAKRQLAALPVSQLEPSPTTRPRPAPRSR